MTISGATTWKRPVKKAVEEKPKGSGKKWGKIIAAVLALGIAGGAAVLLSMKVVQQQRVANAKAALAAEYDSKPYSDFNPRSVFRNDAMQNLSWEQRRDLMEEYRTKREIAILALPNDQRIAEVDKILDQMEKQKEEWAKRRAEQQAKQGASGGGNGQTAGNRGPQGGPPGGPPGGGGDGQGGPGGPGGGRGGRGSRNPDERVAGAHRWLQSTSAEGRVARSQFRELMQARATQRGITMPQFGPRN